MTTSTSTSTSTSMPSRKRKGVCDNPQCNTTETPQWRKGWIGDDGTPVRLCNACGIHFQKRHYCYYCKEIYRRTSDIWEAPEPWICCSKCNSYVHEECEKKHTQNTNLTDNFICPWCRDGAPPPKRRSSSSKSKSRSTCKPNSMKNIASFDWAVTTFNNNNNTSNFISKPRRTRRKTNRINYTFPDTDDYWEELATSSNCSFSSDDSLVSPVHLEEKTAYQIYGNFPENGKLSNFFKLCTVAVCERLSQQKTNEEQQQLHTHHHNHYHNNNNQFTQQQQQPTTNKCIETTTSSVSLPTIKRMEC